MKPRHPTPEERALWRESNRFTDGVRHAPEDEDAPLAAADAPAAMAQPAVALPVVRKRAAALPPLKPLPLREAAKALKPYGPVQATLDLHGLTKLAAHERVHGFIAQQQRSGRRHLIIITGKGRGGEAGVLRSNLPHWLNEAPLRPLISLLAYARPEKGGAGVLHVVVKRL
ncbi:MAG: Smr/MutS family protein [Pseudomonadota bacterium]